MSKAQVCPKLRLEVSRRQLAQLPLPLENVALAPAVCTGAAEIVASAWREAWEI
jgi:hypothetical protein